MSKKGLFGFLDLTFLVSFLLSLTVVALRTDIYARPISYFILTSFAASLIAAEIFLFQKENTRTFLILGKILLVSASLRVVPQLLYPGLIGVDPWYHQALFNQIIAQGKIPLGTGYSWLPVFHLIAVSFSSLTCLDYKISVMASTGFFNIISLVFVFLIGKRVLDVRTGLLAALIAGIATWYANAGFWIIPNTLGVAFILLGVYLVMKLNSGFNPRFAVLCVLISMAIIMTHALATLAMSLILGFLPLTQWIMRKRSRNSEASLKFQVLFFGSFTTAMVGYWTFVSGHIRNVISALQHAFRFEHLVAAQPVVSFRSSHFAEFLAGTTGILLFYGLAVLALVLCFRKILRGLAPLAVAGIVVTLPAFFGYVFSLSALYPQRWFIYSEPIIAIFVALGLISLVTRKSARKSGLLGAIAVVIVLLLSFLAITNPVSNVDAPIYTPNLTVRFFFYDSEIDAGLFLRHYVTEKFYADALYHSYLQKSFGGGVDFSEAAMTKDFSGMHTIALRRIVAEDPFYVSGYLGTYKLDYDIVSLVNLDHSRVFDSGSVQVYSNPNVTAGK